MNHLASKRESERRDDSCQQRLSLPALKGNCFAKMSWLLFLLAISPCLFHAIQTAPKSNSLGNEAELSSDSASQTCLDCQLTSCDQCQTLAIAILWSKYESDLALTTVKMACRTDRMIHPYENFCAQIQGKEADFVNAVLESKKNGTGKEVCARSDFSVCDLSEIDDKDISEPMTLSTCEQCRRSLLVLTRHCTYIPIDGLPFDRLYYYNEALVDSLKKVCGNTSLLSYFFNENLLAEVLQLGFRLSIVDYQHRDGHWEKSLEVNGKYMTEFCAMIDGKEFDFVKSAMDCSGIKFKYDKVQPNCTVSGSDDDRGRMSKVCESLCTAV
ncbi:hypothetical protein DdX_16806 [Ditylenchus destructor]|uniref:Uncharacterized protein n=1 Tax=Ditylenchus destructor TaxID=166010 RepID=A0AAD4MMH2_9BILA|nr:hypothetical protein DdX_16806 [Ditylenchus destructor]